LHAEGSARPRRIGSALHFLLLRITVESAHRGILRHRLWLVASSSPRARSSS